MGDPICSAFKGYDKVPETVPLEFSKENVTWVASMISGTIGALGEEVTELDHWLLQFVCVLEELHIVVAGIAGCLDNSSPLWFFYWALMECWLVELEYRPGFRPVGIGEALRRALENMVLRAAGD